MIHTDKVNNPTAGSMRCRAESVHTHPGALKLMLRCFLSVICLLLQAQTVSAETRQAEIVTTDIQRDLTVMFTFDSEVVDLVFVSPSGEEKTASDPDVAYASGDLWCTYRISDAEAGVWSVRYDLKGNSEINYSVIEDDYGLWLQYFEIEEADDEKASVRFEADCETRGLNYNYIIYAVGTQDPEAILELSSGYARSGEEKSVSFRLNSLSSGNYMLRLDVFYREGDAELFDSLTTEPFDYTNPRQPDRIEDFALGIDLGNLTCSVDWSAHAMRACDSYRLFLYGEDELLYSGELERNTTSTRVVFPEGTKQLTAELSYRYNGLWSKPLSKTVALDGEYLRLVTGDVTNSSQAVLEYLTTDERTLEVSINDVAGSYLLREGGTLSFDLQQGNNSIHAEFESDLLVSFVVDAQVYFDEYPPEIKLYENLDGKTFLTDSVDILGKISGGNRLLVDGRETQLGEGGEFCIRVPLTVGENVVSIEALDVNGNSALMSLSLYRASGVLGPDAAKGGAPRLLPLFISLALSLLAIILSAVLMKKREKTKAVKTIRLWKWILWDIALALTDAACIYGFVIYYLRVSSEDYLELVEKSVSQAVRYLRLEQALAIASLAISLLLALSVAITVFRGKKKKKTKAGSPAAEEA